MFAPGVATVTRADAVYKTKTAQPPARHPSARVLLCTSLTLSPRVRDLTFGGRVGRRRMLTCIACSKQQFAAAGGPPLHEPPEDDDVVDGGGGIGIGGGGGAATPSTQHAIKALTAQVGSPSPSRDGISVLGIGVLV